MREPIWQDGLLETMQNFISHNEKGLRCSPFSDSQSRSSARLVLFVLALSHFDHCIHGKREEKQQKTSDSNNFQLQHVKRPILIVNMQAQDLPE
jgi:hypothetical protein